MLNSMTNSSNKTLELASKITFRSISVSNLKFDNQTNEIIVTAGAKVYGHFTFNIQPKEKYQFLRQILIGIKDLGPKDLALSEQKIIGKRLEGMMSVDAAQKVYGTYADYKKEFAIKAPEAPGVYELEVCMLELEGEAIEQSSSLKSFFKLKEKDEEMLSSKEGLNYLWNMNEKNCKISLGYIRVI